MGELFKSVKGYEGVYEISNYGRIKSLERPNIYRGRISERYLKFFIGTKGYFQVRLYNNDKGKTFKVHRLVALHYLDNTNNYPQINHIDGNKLNNQVTNLEWCTNSQNMAHSLENEFHKHKGEYCPFSKLNNEKVRKIKYLLREGRSVSYIAKMFQVSYGAIWLIANDRTWLHIVINESSKYSSVE